MSTGGPGRDTAYDGKWNPRVGAYILPPLIGLPFDEMVKNGEGVRHASDPKYFKLIVVHAVFMAIPFLILIPAAIFSARFKKHENHRKAIQLHFILNTTSVVFLTIGFLAGWFALNKGEWGGNPHHLIGVTIYGGVVLQGLFGVLVRAREKNKMRKLGQVGLMSMLHMWFGRGLWLLGLAQIPLGLYLYGSPLVLFIIYGALTFLIFVAYFIFEYVSNRRTAKYQAAPGAPPPSAPIRGGSRSSEGSSHPSHHRNPSHSGISYYEMSPTTNHPTTTATTPGTGTLLTRTSYDGQEGTEYHDHGSAAGGFGSSHHHANMPTTPMISKLNSLSQAALGRLRQGYGSPPVSLDASTRPPTGSTWRLSIGHGLNAPPKKGTTNPALNTHHFRRDDDPLKDKPGPQRPEMLSGGQTTTTATTITSSATSTVSPASSGIAPKPRPQSVVSSLSSEVPGAKYSGGLLLSPFVSPIKAPPSKQQQGKNAVTPMLPSAHGDEYLLDEGPASPPPQKMQYPPLLPSNPPRVPLPMPPEPNRRSNNSSNHRPSHDRVPSDTSTQPDAVIRIPLSGNSDTINIPAGELIRNNLPPGEQPQVSVQLKFDRTAKSVTVRRLPEEEAALERARRSRERQARAEERERRIGRDLAARRRGTGGTGISEVSGGTGVTTVSSGTLPHVLPPPPGASGSAGKNVVVLPAPPSPHHNAYTDEEDEDYTSDEREYPTNQQQPAVSAVGSRISGHGGASVVSAAPTDDAEAEEKIRERRRRKRREERKEGGLSSRELAGGTYYGRGGGGGGSGGAGASGEGGVGLGSSGTGTGTGTVTGSLVKNMEWS